MSDQLAQFEGLLRDIQSFSSLGIRPGMERVTRLLSRLGSPEKAFPAIHVLGTNGKGSTAATLESVCEAAGIRTALYTSPHLSSLRERLRVGKKHVDITIWRDAFKRVMKAVDDDSPDTVRPTFFENLTALAFLAMSESCADVAIIEAGMGGRYDATSACRAVATVITPIGMDHMEYLGDTIQAIAGEKFAAIKGGVSAFYAGDDEALSAQFAERCDSAGAPHFLMNRIARPRNIRCTLGGTSFDYVRLNPEDGPPTVGLETPLIGIHQSYNASNAVTALLELRKTVPLFGRIGEAQIRRGLAAVDWPGRMEICRPGPDAPMILLDGAHNEHGFTALVKSLSLLRESGQISGVGAVVFAVMRDKDMTGIARLLKRLSSPVFPTRLAMTRSRPADDLATLLEKAGCETRGVWEDPASALAAAIAATDPGGLVVCCGSLFLVGAMRDLLPSFGKSA
ncbi:MAG: bifunctional folylpolyglutamate synthase/dihydrofolate synthase [Synergistaceae bacterium]|jgi:dihydrofolate synthase/folylpolyglutamate synthase|nr:bifunctional folylpolyglutamate synthase/dihydrofolate synthase [Synergistaceae bacterium]